MSPDVRGSGDSTHIEETAVVKGYNVQDVVESYDHWRSEMTLHAYDDVSLNHSTRNDHIYCRPLKKTLSFPKWVIPTNDRQWNAFPCHKLYIKCHKKGRRHTYCLLTSTEKEVKFLSFNALTTASLIEFYLTVSFVLLCLSPCLFDLFTNRNATHWIIYF